MVIGAILGKKVSILLRCSDREIYHTKVNCFSRCSDILEGAALEI